MIDLPNEILDKVRELNFLTEFCNGKAKGEDALRIAKLLHDLIFYDERLASKEYRMGYKF